MTGFQVNQLFRLATAKIFCSPPGCMLVESSEDIDSDAGIERVVGTEDDIDGPAHGGLMIKKTRTHKIPLFRDADGIISLC